MTPYHHQPHRHHAETPRGHVVIRLPRRSRRRLNAHLRKLYDPAGQQGGVAMLDVALATARAGLHVFPVVPNGKQPLVAGGFHAATTDEDQIRAWWGEWPDANIGVSVGAAGLAVLDADAKSDGLTTLAALEATHGRLPEDALRVRTPGGGLHVWMRDADGTIASSAGRIGQGVDIRARGGYVLAPGSVVDGRSYTIEGGTLGLNQPDAPAWLVQMAGQGMERDPGADRWLVEADLPENVARARDYLRREVARGRVAIEGSGGDNWSYATAAVLRDFALSEDTAFRLMLAEWNPYCVPPWQPEELRKIVEHAYRYAARPAGTKATGGEVLEEMAGRAAEVVQWDPMPANDATGHSPAVARKERYSPLRWQGMRDLPPPSWLVQDILPAHGLTEVFGPWGSYKTFVTLDLALHMAAGMDWCGHGVARPLSVVYAAGEGVFGLRQRALAWADHHGVAEVEGFALIPAIPMFSDDDDFRVFLEAINGMSIDVLVLDTAAHAMTGLDENSAKDTGIFIHRLMQLRETFGCTIILVHHSGKEAEKGSRGSTARPAAMDAQFEVKDIGGLKAKIVNRKQKDAPLAPEIVLQGQRHGDSLVFTPAVDVQSMVDAEGRKIDRQTQAFAEMEHRHWATKAVDVLKAHVSEGSKPRTWKSVGYWTLANEVAMLVDENPARIRKFIQSAKAKKTAPIAQYVTELDNKRRPEWFRYFEAPSNAESQD